MADFEMISPIARPENRSPTADIVQRITEIWNHGEPKIKAAIKLHVSGDLLSACPWEGIGEGGGGGG